MTDDSGKQDERGFSRPPVNKRVTSELDFHIEMRTRELIASGLSEPEARKRAVAAFGDLQQVRSELNRLERGTDRAVRRTRYFSELLQDISFAFRMLRRRRSFAAVAIATLAIGIGAATAIYSIVDGVLLKPLPFSEADRLVAVWITQPRLLHDPTISWLAEATPLGNYEYQSLQQRATMLRELALWYPSVEVVTTASGTERLPVTIATHNLLSTLRKRVAFGRDFQQGDDALNAAPVALLSHEAWESRYGADSNVVGRSAMIEGTPFTIVGVLPIGIRVDRTGDPAVYWVPALRDSNDIAERHNSSYRGLARLAPGATIEGASAQVSGIIKTIRDTLQGGRVAEWQWDQSRNARQPLFILLGASALLLLIACVNVAVLMLGESGARARELAARAALGAGSGRLIRQLLAESVVVAMAGALCGVIVAWATMRGLVSLAPEKLPGLDEVALNLRVLAFTIGCAVTTGVLFGIVPAITAARWSSESPARSGVGQSVRGIPKLQRLLIAGELALSMMLLVGASLLARSLNKLSSVDPGFQPAGVTAVSISLPWSQYRDDGPVRAVTGELLRQFGALPGVQRVVLASNAPFVSGYSSSPVQIEGHQYTKDDKPRHTQQRYISAGFFELLGLRLMSGRFLNEDDRNGTEPVAVVSAAEVKRDFDGRSPLGIRVKHQGVWRRVVGVVADVKYRGLGVDDEPTLYVPFDQSPNGGLVFLMRGTAGVSVAPSVKRILHDVEPSAYVRAVKGIPELLEKSYAAERYRTTLVSAFGIIAALLAAVGMYGVSARAAASRRKEMGIRLALGGTSAMIERLMVGEALRGVAMGLLLGIPAALLAGRIVAPYLFKVTPGDPVSLAGAAAFLVFVALVASFGPARRAGRVAPAAVLRGE